MEMKNELKDVKATSIAIKIVESVLDDEETDEIEIIGPVEDVSEEERFLKLFDQDELELVETRSARTSLIITHEDGSTEESEADVTCLGVTHHQCDHLNIEELVNKEIKFELNNNIQDSNGCEKEEMKSSSEEKCEDSAELKDIEIELIKIEDNGNERIESAVEADQSTEVKRQSLIVPINHLDVQTVMDTSVSDGVTDKESLKLRSPGESCEIDQSNICCSKDNEQISAESQDISSSNTGPEETTEKVKSNTDD